VREYPLLPINLNSNKMENELQGYNSDSGEENVDIDALSDENPQIGWVQWFCSLEGHEYLAEIDEDFLKDAFNLFGLSQKFSKDKFKYPLFL